MTKKYIGWAKGILDAAITKMNLQRKALSRNSKLEYPVSRL